jgi:hypothetical protein
VVVNYPMFQRRLRADDGPRISADTQPNNGKLSQSGHEAGTARPKRASFGKYGVRLARQATVMEPIA